ncbi:MAG TPA: TPM domain-containing protein [Candidatus Ozemobacteraceae bacterium]|nr:TPM domain-containing protein [Candidatus Ozemobacteraceae bacterium]
MKAVGLLLIALISLASFPLTAYAQPASETAAVPVSPDRYISDQALLLKEPIRLQIVDVCSEIEKTLRIRVLVKTEVLENIDEYTKRVELFFTEWIRSIGIDKRGILLYAALPRDSLNGKFSLRVGIGLKYLITREMGEKILNQVILPGNVENDDGRGFLEGILTIKKMLVDELKRENHDLPPQTGTFDIFGFLWTSKEILLAFFVGGFLCYMVFFIERCPRCNGSLRTAFEILKEPGNNTLGLRRRLYSCDRCGFTRRKKEPIYPAGSAGFWMWLLGTRRNVRIDTGSTRLPDDLSSDDRHSPSE